MNKCKQNFHALNVTTLRGSISASHNTWAGVLYDGETMYESAQYQITHIVDRVGEEIPLWSAHLWTHPLPEDDQRALLAVASLKAHH